MTREEAIDIIKCLAWHTRPNEEDIEQAIKALEQEPCENAISRQAVLNKILKFSVTDGRSVSVTGLRTEINDMPSVTPQEPILDKIRAEIKALSPEPTAYDVVDGNPIKDAVWETLADVLQIIDKHKAESEEEDGNK